MTFQDYNPRSKHRNEHYVGKWVIIEVPGSHNTYSGKLARVEDNYLIISPFLGIDHMGTISKKILIDDEQSIPRFPNLPIMTPTTEENLRAFMKKWDEEEERRVKKGLEKKFEEEE